MHTKSFIAAFAKGYATALKYPGILFMKWLSNLIFAFVFIFPLAFMLTSDWRHRLDAPALQGDLTYNQIAEFIVSRLDVLMGLGLAAIPSIMIILILSLAINGAVIKVYQTRRRHTWSQFFGFCWSYLPSMLVIGFLALIFLMIIVGGLYGISTEVVDTGSKAIGSPSVKFYATWLVYLVIIVLLSWLSRVYDVARILVCESRDKKPIRAFLKAIRFVNTHHWRSFYLWSLFMAALLAIHLIYGWTQQLFSVDSPHTLLITLALGQVLVLLREINGLATLGGFIAFLDGRLEPVAQVQAPSEPAEDYLRLDPQA